MALDLIAKCCECESMGYFRNMFERLDGKRYEKVYCRACSVLMLESLNQDTASTPNGDQYIFGMFCTDEQCVAHNAEKREQIRRRKEAAT